jgi:hypothetical protein
MGLLDSGAKAGRGAPDELTASLLPIEADRQRSSGGASARFDIAVTAPVHKAYLRLVNYREPKLRAENIAESSAESELPSSPLKRTGILHPQSS